MLTRLTLACATKIAASWSLFERTQAADTLFLIDRLLILTT